MYLHNYHILRCFDVATASSHYIKKNVLKFVKKQFDDLITFLFENSNRLSLFIYWSRILSIYRSIIRKIKLLFYKEFLSSRISKVILYLKTCRRKTIYNEKKNRLKTIILTQNNKNLINNFDSRWLKFETSTILTINFIIRTCF